MRRHHRLIWLNLFIVLCGTLCLQAAIYLNDPPPDVANPCVVTGTSKFLSANADVSLLLTEVELAEERDFDVDFALRMTESAIDKLRQAQACYAEGSSIGKKVPVALKLVYKYKAFDYRGFALDKGLNTVVVDELEGFMKRGDFMGVLDKSIGDIDEIIAILEAVRSRLLEGVKPDVSLFRSLYHRYSEAGLFGCYATMLFNDVPHQ